MSTGQQSEGERSSYDLSGPKEPGVSADTRGGSRNTPVSTGQQSKGERSRNDLSGASKKAAASTNSKSLPASVVPRRRPNLLALMNNRERLSFHLGHQGRKKAAIIFARHGTKPNLANMEAAVRFQLHEMAKSTSKRVRMIMKREEKHRLRQLYIKFNRLRNNLLLKAC